MSEYVIDLADRPYNRWACLDHELVRELVEAGYQELRTAVPAWALGAAELALRGVHRLFRWHAYVEEIEGIAERSGVPLERLLLMNLSYDLASSGVPFPGMLGCTGALVRTKEGIAIARSMDWSFPEEVLEHTSMFRFVNRKQPGEEILSVGFPGFVGIVSGLNSDGLAITLNQAFVEQMPLPGLPVPWLIRRTLELYGTHASGVDGITGMSSMAPGIYFVTDGERGSIIESTGLEDTVYDLPSNEKFMVAANHFEDDEIPDEREWGDSFERHEKLERALRAKKSPKAALCVSPVEHAATAHQLVVQPSIGSLEVRCPNEESPTWKVYKHGK